MSNPIRSFWSGLSHRARVATIAGLTAALALLSWALFSAFDQDYRVLFAELAQGDAATIVARLKKDKVPYRLDQGGSAILIPAAQVHDVRLALMAGDLPLSGGVGFEIFDKQGLGATEHSQRVSYQRALQGELARTIAALENVKHVRVHLVMPESTLFTRDRQQASAAVAVSMQPGTSLHRQQIAGVQRLVAAAVSGLTAERVVITDQRGVMVSSADLGATAAGAVDARLQVKRDVEEYITHKIARLLDGTFGPGQAIVSVDAALNFDASKTTIQDLLPAGGGNTGEGRIVRRRQVTGSSTTEPLWTSAADAVAPARTPGSSLEVEYEYGRRIDEVIAAPGALTRISVGVVVPDEVSEEQRRKVTELVRMAAGIDERRGDAITVQPLSQLGAGSVFEVANDAPQAYEPEPQPLAHRPPALNVEWMVGVLAIVLVVSALLLAVSNRSRRARPLSAHERQRLLEDIQRVLAEEGRPAAGRARV